MSTSDSCVKHYCFVSDFIVRTHLPPARAGAQGAIAAGVGNTIVIGVEPDDARDGGGDLSVDGPLIVDDRALQG
jgi:hypothetical protein